METNVETLEALVRAKVESLRPKLLDLSRRNPLIATKLGPRSNSHIRAVDELPDVLFFKLNNGQEMNLIPLPPIEEDPRDEQTESFREALINARLTDETYVSSMEAVDGDADNYLEKTRENERELKDKIREQLGLAPRVQKTEVNLVQHARNASTGGTRRDRKDSVVAEWGSAPAIGLSYVIDENKTATYTLSGERDER